MAQIPRRSSGVQRVVGKSARSGDTRDARDDATIISWLQRIDMDVIRAARVPFAQGSVSPRGEATQSPATRNLENQIQSIGVSATSFQRGVESAKSAVLNFATFMQPSRWLGMMEGIKQAFRILSAPSMATSDEESSQGGTRARKPKPPAYDSPVRLIGDALRGTNATQEVSWAAIKSGLGGAMPPPIRVGPNAGSQLFRPGAGALFGMSSGAGAGAAGLGAGAGVAGASGSILPGLAIGGVAAAIASIGAVAVGFAVLPPLLSKFGQSVFDANRQFSASGAMANVLAQQNVRDVLRNMSTGDRTAASAAFLGKSLGNLKDDLQPMIILVRNTMNLFAGVLIKVASFFVNLPVFAGKSVKEIMQALNKIIENTLPEVEGESMGEWLDNVARTGSERKSGAYMPFAKAGTTKTRVARNLGGPLMNSSGDDF